MSKKKSVRVSITLEYRTNSGTYRYLTYKNRQNISGRLEIKKYSPVTKRHELFKEIK